MTSTGVNENVPAPLTAGCTPATPIVSVFGVRASAPENATTCPLTASVVAVSAAATAPLNAGCTPDTAIVSTFGVPVAVPEPAPVAETPVGVTLAEPGTATDAPDVSPATAVRVTTLVCGAAV